MFGFIKFYFFATKNLKSKWDHSLKIHKLYAFIGKVEKWNFWWKNPLLIWHTIQPFLDCSLTLGSKGSIAPKIGISICFLLRTDNCLTFFMNRIQSLVSLWWQEFGERHFLSFRHTLVIKEYYKIPLKDELILLQIIHLKNRLIDSTDSNSQNSRKKSLKN